jgi:hypothetical protein
VTYHEGQIVTVPAERAEALVKLGYARAAASLKA